jgi:hypothetical protein
MAFAELPVETDPDAVTARLLDAIKTRIPDWTAAEGDPITVLAEEIGRETANLRALARDAAAVAVAGFGTSVHGVPEIAARTATMSVRLTLTGPGASVPAGFTVVGRTTASLDVAFNLAAGATGDAAGIADVTMTAAQPGAASNGVPVGPLTPITATSTVVSAAALAPSSGGLDAESLGAYLDRLTAHLSILRPGGVRADDLAVLARTVPGVHRALGVDLLDPGRTVTDGVTTASSTTVTSATAAFTATDVGRTITGGSIPAGATITAVGSATSVTISAAATASATAVTLTLGDITDRPKTVTVVPVDENGLPVPGFIADEVRRLMESVREVNFIVRIGVPTYTPVHVAFVAVAETGVDPADAQAAVHAAATEFLDPGRWAEGDDPDLPVWKPLATVRYLELTRTLGSAPGVAFLSDLTVNGARADFTLAGYAPLPAPTSGVANPSTITGTAS